MTFNIIRLDTIVKVLEEPGLGGRDFSVSPPSWASHIEEVGDNSLHWIPDHVDEVDAEFVGGKVEVIEMPVIHNLVIFLL